MKEEKQGGQSIILVAIMALALVALAAMAVDLSSAYFNRRTAQNAADAAALSAAEELAWQRNRYGKNVDKNKGAQDINIAGNELAERNGIEDTDPLPEINDNVELYYTDPDGNPLSLVPTGKNDTTRGDAFGIRALTYITAPTFLGGVLGWDGYPVNAVAAVSIRAPVCAVDCVVPIATYWNISPTLGLTRTFETSDVPNWLSYTQWTTTSVTPFQCYNIWNGGDPGNFGWLQWSLQDIFCDTDDCGEQCLGDNLNPEYCIGYLGIGEWVAGGPGTVNGDYVRERLDEWISEPGFWEDPDDPGPRDFTVPVYTIKQGGGCNDEYLVAGFARMQLIGYKLSQGGSATVEVDPWVDPSICTDISEDPFGVGIEPNNGRRLTAIFYDLILEDALTGDCEPYGTISTIRIKE
jgi:Flp pilus assembly protein TadG